MKYKYLFIFGIFFISSCSNEIVQNNEEDSIYSQTYNWRLVTAWPKNYPGLGMAPEKIAQLVEEMSNGQMKITVYGAGEQVPALSLIHI